MPPRKRPIKPEILDAVTVMLIQDFRRHCQERHRDTIRFASKGEHESSHRLFAERLDHIHTNQQDRNEDRDKEEGILCQLLRDMG